METNSFVNVILNVPDFRYGLFDTIGATATSIVATMCGVVLTRREKLMYLNPLKDMPQIAAIPTYINTLGGKYSIAGMNTVKLTERIKNPFKHWSENPNPGRLTFWLITEEINTITVAQRLVITALTDNINPVYIYTHNPRPGQRLIEFGEPYPFRIVVCVLEWKETLYASNMAMSFMHTRDELADWRLVARNSNNDLFTLLIRPQMDPFVNSMVGCSNSLTNADVFALDQIPTDGDEDDTGCSDVSGAIFNVVFNQESSGYLTGYTNKFNVAPGNQAWSEI